MQRKEGDTPAEEDACLRPHSRGEQLLGHAALRGDQFLQHENARLHLHSWGDLLLGHAGLQGKEGDALSRVAAMFATTAAHSFIVINSSQS
jgi:hypothetical protein